MTSPQIHYYNTTNGITAFSTTRHGGKSEGRYAEMNINDYCGDLPEHTAANRLLLATALGVGAERMIVPHQTHETEIRQIASDFLTLPTEVRQMVLEGVDGVMTDVPGVCVGVSTADCIPVLIYDRQRRAVCAVHAGWRGTQKRIAGKAVAAMSLTYSIPATDLMAIIGPGISADKFEVGDEVYDAFAKAGFDMTKIALRKEKWHIDLPECNRLQLAEAGIPPGNIFLSGICTYTSHDEYFSARRLGTASGRIYSGIIIR